MKAKKQYKAAREKLRRMIERNDPRVEEQYMVVCGLAHECNVKTTADLTKMLDEWRRKQDADFEANLKKNNVFSVNKCIEGGIDDFNALHEKHQAEFTLDDISRDDLLRRIGKLTEASMGLDEDVSECVCTMRTLADDAHFTKHENRLNLYVNKFLLEIAELRSTIVRAHNRLLVKCGTR